MTDTPDSRLVLDKLYGIIILLCYLVTHTNRAERELKDPEISGFEEP